MVELALDAHSSILIESYSMKESERRTYIGKCVEDIRKVGTSSPEKDEGFSEHVFYFFVAGCVGGAWVQAATQICQRFLQD